MRRRRLLLGLLLVSLVVRLLVWIPVVVHETPPAYNEQGYMRRSEGYANGIRTTLRMWFPAEGEASIRDHGYWDAAYGLGNVPPLQNMVLALALLPDRAPVASARLMMVLLSALTTPIVYLLALRFTDSRGAFFAASAHILYPGFVGYSHLLWATTTFILFLLLSLMLAIDVRERAEAGRPIGRAVLCGFLLGATVLTRAAGIVFLVTLPLWMAFALRRRPEKLLMPAVVLLTACMTLVPWELVLRSKEGRFMMVTTVSTRNLYKGNNPYVTEGEESGGIRGIVVREIERYAKERGLDPYDAARELAIREIRRDPAGFAQRAWIKLRNAFLEDRGILRHIYRGPYPRMPRVLGLSLWAWLIVSFLAMIAFAAAGFLWRAPPLRYPGVLGLPFFCQLALFLLTISNTRYMVPLLALLLPAIGHGLARLGGGSSNGIRKWLPLAVAVLSALNIFTFPGPRWPNEPETGRNSAEESAPAAPAAGR